MARTTGIFWKLAAVAVLLLLTAALMSCGGRKASGAGENMRDSVETRPDTTAILYNSILNCSRLATAEYRIHKIVTFDDRITVRGKLFSQPFSHTLPVGDRKIAIPIDVTLRGAVDFSGFSERSIRRRGRKIEIVLPDPEIMVSASRVDHKRTLKLVDPLRSDFKQEEIEKLTLQGMDSIAAVIPSLGIVENARRGAARVLVPLITQMGYAESDITISFRPAVSDRTIFHWSEIGNTLKQQHEI